MTNRSTDMYDSYQDLRLSEGPLRVHRAGPTDAPPVLLLHGSMLDNAHIIWRHLVPALATKWNVVVPDLPRHGGSRPWTGTVDQPRIERTIDELLDELGIERTAIVGLSMGGGVGTGYALARPERVNALVAIGPGALEDSRPWQFLIWLMSRRGPLMRWYLKWMNSPSWMRKTMAGVHTHGEDTRDFDELMDIVMDELRDGLRHREGALDDWQIEMFGPWRMRVNFAPRLHKLAVPSLWMHGEHDKLPGIREEIVLRAARLAPGGRFLSIPDAGHLAPLDEPERVNTEVASFLEEIHLQEGNDQENVREGNVGPEASGAT
ncbi:alpha/beta fold hydrolase [Nocardiopsis oceani]